VWQLRGVRENTGKGRCPCLGEEAAQHTLLNCLGTRNWRLKFLNDKRLNVDEEVAYRKILRCIIEDQIIKQKKYQLCGY
jgi:hypothetical protein